MKNKLIFKHKNNHAKNLQHKLLNRKTVFLIQMRNTKIKIFSKIRKMPINPYIDWFYSEFQKVTTVTKKLPNGNFLSRSDLRIATLLCHTKINS